MYGGADDDDDENDEDNEYIVIVVVRLLERLHLGHDFALPQWQHLRVVGYLFLDHLHVQVLALRLEEVSVEATEIPSLLRFPSGK